MFLFIEFTYGTVWDKFDAEQISEIVASFPNLKPEKDGKILFTPHGNHLLTDDNLSIAKKYGLAFKPSETQLDGTTSQMLVTLQDRIAALELSQKNQATQAELGGIVQIHVPDFCLMQISEVEVIEDCCTDICQGMLDEGWRILAVCPPNAKRRPDYVFGRRKVE